MFGRLGLVPLAAGFARHLTVMFLGWFQQQHSTRSRRTGDDAGAAERSGRAGAPAGRCADHAHASTLENADGEHPARRQRHADARPELNLNMLAVGATFVREDETDACYRIWTIDDRHPAMMRTWRRHAWRSRSGASRRGLGKILQSEPPGPRSARSCCETGRSSSASSASRFCAGRREITEFGGWRAYMASKSSPRRRSEPMRAGATGPGVVCIPWRRREAW